MPHRPTPSDPPLTLHETGSRRAHRMTSPPTLAHAPRATRRHARVARFAALVATVLTAATATPAVHGASASSTVNSGSAPQLGGFSARALGEDGQVTPQTYFELKLRPGESFDGDILVTNASKDFVRLKVDSVDGLTGQTSGTVYANRTDDRLETSRWIRPKKKALRLDGASSRKLGFHLHVPDDARPGDHVGAVAFQRILNPKKEGNFSVRQVLRVAVAIQIRVEGPASPRMEIGKLSLKALGGTQIPSVGIELKNTGQLLCRPALTVSLSQDGTGLGEVSKQLDTILAGDTIDFPLPWPKPLKAGTYEATAATTGCGQPAKVTATVELADTLRGTTGAPGPDVSMLDDEDGLPWWALALGIAAALGLGFLLARRTSHKDDEPAAPAAAAPAAAALAQSAEQAPAKAAEPQPATAVEPEPAAAEAASARAVEPEPEPPAPQGAQVVEPEPDRVDSGQGSSSPGEPPASPETPER